MNKIDFINQKYNSDNKIKELERHLEKYKKENILIFNYIFKY